MPGDTLVCSQTLPQMQSNSLGQLVISINILGSTVFNSFGIAVHWDSIFNASNADLTASIIQNRTVSTDCFNGAGANCGARDGLGVGHLDVTGGNTTAPASGRLFKMTLFGPPGVDPHIGFARGCSTVGFLPAFTGTGSVPNTDVCVFVGILAYSVCLTVCTLGLTEVPESIQSQHLGVHLPSPLASVSPTGLITGRVSAGGGPNFAETWVMPYQITMPGNITEWSAQFTNGFMNSTLMVPPTPVGVQIKVLRKTNTTFLTVVHDGPIHNPRQVLASRLPSYPFVLTQSEVIPYYTDSLLSVLPGDFLGFTIFSNSTYGRYDYPTVNATGGTRYVSRNVSIGGVIDLSSIYTGMLTDSAPAIDVTIQPSPPRLDTPGDGIPDFVALSPEMQSLGVDPCRKTVLAQVDYMVPATGPLTFKPLPDAISFVTTAFDDAPIQAVSNCPYPGFPLRSTGVKLVLDVRNPIPEQDVLSFWHSEPQSFDTIKAAYFDPNRAHYFHYGLFVNQTVPGRSISGVGEIFGSNFIVSLGNWTNKVGSVFEQAGTLMHELGHNLGLQHGGVDPVNRKPNYLSVMSYEHQVVGIITKTPTGNVTRFDFSREVMPTLNESSLNDWTVLSDSSDYTSWVCPDHHTVRKDLVSHPLDWGCEGKLSSGVVDDLNNDTMRGILAGFDDWANLKFNFTESSNFNTGCSINCDIGCSINCDIGCSINCDIGCSINCDIGCRICAFGEELDRPTALAIEASWAAFLSLPHRSTSTSVTCAPASLVVGFPSTCTASVSDIDPGNTVTPTGTVSFESSQAGTFTPTICSLGGGSTSCAVNYSPGTGSSGPQTITAGYTGDTSHLGSSGSTSVSGLPPPAVALSKFFTDSTLNPLPSDTSGNPSVNVVLSGNIVKVTNPGEIIGWLNMTNTGNLPLHSLKLNDTLPVDWVVAPIWLPGKGAVHVYYANTTSLSTNSEITQPNTITVAPGNPEMVMLAIPSLNATAIGHPLLPGQSILLGVKLDYGLVGTAQSALSYPRNYTDIARAGVWTKLSFTGAEASGKGSAFFIAHAKVVGDADGDGHVDINDLVLVARSFGAKPGDANWNGAADLNNDGIVDISDLSIVSSHFGT